MTPSSTRRRLRVVAAATLACAVATVTVSPAATGTEVISVDSSELSIPLLRGAAAVHRITYTSVDAQGRPVETKANLYIPEKKRADGSVRLMAYAHGTIGLGPECSFGTRFNGSGRFDDWLGPWLESGYALVIPEYAGLADDSGHAYNHGDPAARNTIDAVRAARALYPELGGQELAPGFVTDGGSQGGHTSVWVNHLLATEPQYADETLVGTSVTSLPADIGGYVGLINPLVPDVPVFESWRLTTYLANLLAGMENAGVGISDSPVFTDTARSLVEPAKTVCYPNMEPVTAGIAPGSLVTRPLLGTEELAKLTKYAEVPDQGFGAPMLVQQGGIDEVTPASQTTDWVDRSRSAGANIDLRMYPTQGHGLSSDSETTALAWVEGLNWPAA